MIRLIVMHRSRLAVCLLVLPALFLGACGPIFQSRDTLDVRDIPYRGSGYPTLAPLLRRITPAVVNISVESEVHEDHPIFRDPRFRRLLERYGMSIPRESDTSRRRSMGSGFVVDASRGYVLTNRHVIENARAITVTLKDRRNYRARLVGSDPRTDVAILEVAAPLPSGLEALRFGNSNDLEVGDFVLAIGNPFGIGQSVTSGIVSALGRQGIGGNVLGGLIQTDASINPGNSGGPLVNLAGRVVGINTALLGPSGGNVGIGFATPANRVQPAMDEILRGRQKP